MGSIYLIYNNVNQRVYIGQTTNKVEYRLANHFSSFENNKDLKHDIRVYGKEVFESYILENCDDSLLNEREKYYIQLFDSFKNGYNKTIGGGAKPIEYNIKLVSDLYSNGMSLNKIQEITGYRWHKVRQIIDEKIKLKQDTNVVHTSKKQPLIMLDSNLNRIQEFESKVEALRWLIKSTNKQIDRRNFYTRIAIACKQNRVLYGYKWCYKEDVIIDGIEFRSYEDAKLYRKGYKYNVDNNGIAFINNECEELQYTMYQLSTHCIMCGKKIGFRSKNNLCNSCANVKAKNKTPKPSKEELELLLNTTSIAEIAKKYDRTRSTVYAWIKRYGIIK